MGSQYEWAVYPTCTRRDRHMRRLQNIIRFAALSLISITLQSCITGKQLITTSADPKLITGTYTLLLYGCHYPDQIDNVAILVDKNSKYPLEIYDIDTSYSVKNDVPAQQAIAEADTFVQCSSHRVSQTQLTRIPDDSNGTVGYEVRPLYVPTEFGTLDVLIINYSLKDGKIRTYIKKTSQAEDKSGDGMSSQGQGSGGSH
jgi:hypothetical protein